MEGKPMAGRRFVQAVILVFVLAGCSGGPGATSTPLLGPTTAPTPTAAPPTTQPSATPTPTVAPPTATAVPSPGAAEIAAWAADVCAANEGYTRDSAQILSDLPDPTDRTLEAVQSISAQRQLRYEQEYQAALDRVSAVTPYPGGEAFRAALLNEFQVQFDALPAYFQSIADAASLEDIDAVMASRAMVSTNLVLDDARAVSEIDIGFADAVAAITDGCRFFELDARSRVHPDIILPDFTQVAFEDNFDDDSNFSTGPFDGGTRAIADGALTVTFNDSSYVDVAKARQYHDARFETNVRIDGFALAGLACRDTGDKRYSVLVNPIGLLLIYGSDGVVVARRAAPEDFDAANGLNLAIECVAGNLDPFTIAVYIDDELVAEVQQPHAHASEGLAGMFAQSFGAGTSVSYDFFRVLVEPD